MQILRKAIGEAPVSTVPLQKTLRFFLLSVLVFGSVIRLIQYAYNRSLWADEATLALNIVQRSFTELLQPLDYDQVAPVGFLLVEKLAVQLLGNTEYALRLFPFVCGFFSLFLFYQLAKKFLSLPAIVVAVTLFACLEHLVYYANEAKQYSSDVTISLLCTLIPLNLAKKPLSYVQFAGLCLASAVLIWFSHPAIFVLFGTGIVQVWLTWKTSDRRIKQQLIGSLLVWLVSFLVLYFLFLQGAGNNQELQDSWGGKLAFPAYPLDIPWLIGSLVWFFITPLGFSNFTCVFAVIFFTAGCIHFLRHQRQDFFSLIAPVIVTLVAAFLYKYPFQDRVVLFLAPIFLIILAQGTISLVQRSRPKAAVFLSWIALFLLLGIPLQQASELVVKPDLREEIRPAIAYICTHQQYGDLLYVFQRGEYQFRYYAPKFGYQPEDYIIGVDDLDKTANDTVILSPEEWQRYRADLDKLRGNSRVWLLFSHAVFAEERNAIRAYLEQIGQQRKAFRTKGAFVYLYDFSGTR
jgi:hypothetical protein